MWIILTRQLGVGVISILPISSSKYTSSQSPSKSIFFHEKSSDQILALSYGYSIFFLFGKLFPRLFVVGINCWARIGKDNINTIELRNIFFIKLINLNEIKNTKPKLNWIKMLKYKNLKSQNKGPKQKN